MKIQVITSGDSFSTADVCRGLIDGLRANGVQVEVSELADGLDTFSAFVATAATYGLPAPHWAQDAFALAAPRIISQAAWTQPDAAIAVTGLKLHPSVPLTLRKMGIPTALLCTESPYDPTEQQVAPLYDHVFTNERSAATLFAGHPSVHYLPHAYNPAVHQAGAVDPAKRVDAYFVGTAFPERKALFAGVDWTDIRIIREGAMWHTDEVPTPEAIAAGEVDPWHGIQDNATAAAWYRSARISLNHHRTTTTWGSGGHIRRAESLGPRAYEIPACGGFMLCDDSRPELFDVLEDAAAVYKAGDSADMEAQIRYWLKHPERREETARMQHAAIQPHTWHDRAQRVVEVVLNTKQMRRAA